jgi:hypothetical protein
MKLNFLQNNRDRLKLILDNINFYTRVVEMKETYLYEHDGVFVGKMYELPPIEKKITIISSLLNELGIIYKISKKDRLFEINNLGEEYSISLNIGFDVTALGGAFGIYLKNKINYSNLVWGSMFDLILKDFYNYEIKNYRFCTLDEEEVEKITTQILDLFNDFTNEFQKHVKNLII